MISIYYFKALGYKIAVLAAVKLTVFGTIFLSISLVHKVSTLALLSIHIPLLTSIGPINLNLLPGKKHSIEI